jgi:hypothetical protein
LAVAGAAAFGLSFNTIDIGLETRPYALCVTCMLVAFSAYLDWLGSRAAFVPDRKRVMFAGASTAALLNHYATFFFLAAALSVPLVLACFHIRWRVRLAREMRRPLLPALMFGIPVTVGALEYVFHVRRAIALNNHVADSLYHHGRESIAAFVARTTSRLAELFSPDLGWNSTLAAAVMVGSFAAFGVLAARRTFRGRLITVPFVFVVVMWLLNVVAALMGVYPYPGELRHEFHLFAFSLLALFAAIECARRTLPSSWHSDQVWTTIAGMAAAANFALWLSMSPVTHTRLMQPQMDDFRKVTSSPPAILVDQFNLITLFGHHDTADWRLVRQDRKSHPWQLWSVTQPGQRFAVCRSMQWQLDLSSPGTYAEAAHCLELTRAERVALFRPQQSFFEPSWDTKATPSLAAELAPRAGLLTEKVVVEGDDVYASFRFPPREGSHLARGESR